jgi:hypothetical protein
LSKIQGYFRQKVTKKQGNFRHIVLKSLRSHS